MENTRSDRTGAKHTEYHTYDYWKKLGYQVVKGSRHLSRDDTGIPLFSKNQVKLVTKRIWLAFSMGSCLDYEHDEERSRVDYDNSDDDWECQW